MIPDVVGSAAVAVARHSPPSSIAVLLCSAIAASQPRSDIPPYRGGPSASAAGFDFSHCIAPQCGQRHEERR